MNNYTKKILVSISLIMMLFSSGKRASAQLVPTIDNAAIAQAIAQVSKLAQLLSVTSSIDISGALTQINTYKTMYDQTIRRPLQDAMNLVTIKSSANQIINLVNGSTNGNSLLIPNPEKFVKNAGLNATQVSYNLVNDSKGLYSSAIANAIIGATRQEDTEAVLADLTHSDVPATIQKNACTDKALTQMATYNASQNGNTSYTSSDLANEKSSLYNSDVCTGDPADPAVAQKLLAFNSQNPNTGGWDTWLQEIGGDNAYTRSVQAISVVKKDAATKQHFAELDYQVGGGVQSEKTCVKKDSTGACAETAVIKPGSVLRDALSKADTVGLDSAIGSLGTGANGSGLFDDISGLLGNIKGGVGDIFGLGTMGSIAGIGSSIGDVVGAANSARGLISSIGGGLNTSASDAQITAARTPANVAVVASASFTADLVDDSTKKSQLLAPIVGILSAHARALDAVLTIDRTYLAAVQSYKVSLTGVIACYQNLQTYASQNHVAYTPTDSTTAFITNESQSTNALISKLTTESTSIAPSAKNYIQNILGRLNNSNSTEEINYYNNDYRNKVDSGQLLSPTIDTTRSNEFSTYKTVADEAQSPQGILSGMLNDCVNAKATLTPLPQ